MKLLDRMARVTTASMRPLSYLTCIALGRVVDDLLPQPRGESSWLLVAVLAIVVLIQISAAKQWERRKEHTDAS